MPLLDLVGLLSARDAMDLDTTRTLHRPGPVLDLIDFAHNYILP
jgi:hypothetical protein